MTPTQRIAGQLGSWTDEERELGEVVDDEPWCMVMARLLLQVDRLAREREQPTPHCGDPACTKPLGHIGPHVYTPEWQRGLDEARANPDNWLPGSEPAAPEPTPAEARELASRVPWRAPAGPDPVLIPAAVMSAARHTFLQTLDAVESAASLIASSKGCGARNAHQFYRQAVSELRAEMLAPPAAPEPAGEPGPRGYTAPEPLPADACECDSMYRRRGMHHAECAHALRSDVRFALRVSEEQVRALTRERDEHLRAREVVFKNLTTAIKERDTLSARVGELEGLLASVHAAIGDRGTHGANGNAACAVDWIASAKEGFYEHREELAAANARVAAMAEVVEAVCVYGNSARDWHKVLDALAKLDALTVKEAT